MISTDKAVKPSSVMGASKRLAELIVQRKNNQAQTRFACVRFGNVMGSRGSVVPLFRSQIANGGPVTITDPRVSRYFMTIPEAVRLIVQVGLLGPFHGNTYVLDMGNPIRVVDMARDMIEFYGLRPDQDIQIETIGLRPGEKLAEELVGENERLVPTEHPMIFAVKTAVPEDFPHLDELLDNLWNASHQDDVGRLLDLLEKGNLAFERGETAPGTSTAPTD